MSENRLPVAEPIITEDDARAVYEQVRSGWVSMGDRVAEFEERFAEHVGVDHAIAVFNGTVALHTVLAALGIASGDEVIVPSLTFISSANAVEYVGGELVLCDCDEATYNLTAELVQPLITDRTQVLLSVDMNGMPGDYQSLRELALEHDLVLLADSAESLGASYRGAPIGAQADVHVFSMFPNKSITTGEGGMITTNDGKLADRMRILRNQGQDARYHHVDLGFNYRMTDIQAALGLSQLRRVRKVIQEKQRVVKIYEDRLAELAPELVLPVVPWYVTQHSWYMYAVAVRNREIRDSVVEELNSKGIGTRLSFPPVHLQPYYVQEYGYEPDDYPASRRAWGKLIDLPISPKLEESDVDYVASTLRNALTQYS